MLYSSIHMATVDVKGLMSTVPSVTPEVHIPDLWNKLSETSSPMKTTLQTASVKMPSVIK